MLATGEAKYADLIERQFYNAVLSGVSLDGDRYFYVNSSRCTATRSSTTAGCLPTAASPGSAPPAAPPT
ncbi:hypothetical protein G7085_11270 [Tessaracoccus sp. HDW20]|nr:hypothetical protein [Tessaracoccus coleopterorum]